MLRMSESAAEASRVLDQLGYHVGELVRQRDLWQSRYLEAVAERDTARAERDAARVQANVHHMSP